MLVVAVAAKTASRYAFSLPAYDVDSSGPAGSRVLDGASGDAARRSPRERAKREERRVEDGLGQSVDSFPVAS